ncbi:hypothetical protein ACFQ00_17680 [Sphingosinicella xenopeptidilytica]|uniref:Uncharacterized protein n=1 Tax=Sphingosinicella xenopeptidilytica TaxID=364098 RepID=A0ABW3C8H4_SPHXN
MKAINRAFGELSLIQIKIMRFPHQTREPNARFCVNVAVPQLYGATGTQPENKW